MSTVIQFPTPNKKEAETPSNTGTEGRQLFAPEPKYQQAGALVKEYRERAGETRDWVSEQMHMDSLLFVLLEEGYLDPIDMTIRQLMAMESAIGLPVDTLLKAR